jgi:hypothetical protein
MPSPGSSGASNGGSTIDASTVVDDAASNSGTPSSDASGMPAVPGKIGTLKFTRKTLHMLNLAEGIAFGDYNKDGHVDVLSGPYWWEGPAFDTKHQLFPPPQSNVYTGMTLGDWADYAYDVDGDGWVDSINIMRPGTPSYWYKNPGMPAVQTDANWAKKEIGTLSWEQYAFADMAGKGVPGVVGESNGALGWFDPDPVASPWPFHAIAMADNYTWNHGIGTGNILGGSVRDFLNRDGWWSPPAAGPTSGPWTMHSQSFKGAGANGGSQMFGYDVDGDGQTDVISALNAHGYGVAWFQQKGGVFTQHDIVGGPGAMNAGGIPSFSQPHALLVADIDGDGLQDIVTGKSFYAHPPGLGDPDAAGTPVFYVFKLLRSAQGVVWEPHLVDSEVGLGRSLTATDLNGDGLVDIAVACKHGVFLFFQQ